MSMFERSVTEIVLSVAALIPSTLSPSHASHLLVRPRPDTHVVCCSCLDLKTMHLSQFAARQSNSNVTIRFGFSRSHL